MATTNIYKTTKSGKKMTISSETFTGAGETDWIRLSGTLSLQITGDSTAVSATVQRSISVDPSADPAPMGVAVTGNPTTGIPVVAYTEAGVAWFRVNVASLTGTDVTVVLTGQTE